VNVDRVVHRVAESISFDQPDLYAVADEEPSAAGDRCGTPALSPVTDVDRRDRATAQT
jgi:hypothetical protein